MGTVKRTYKLDEAVLADAVALAEKKGTSVTAIIENAIRCYKDYTYMETAAFVPDQFVRQVNASLRLLEKRQNAKTNPSHVPPESGRISSPEQPCLSDG